MRVGLAGKRKLVGLVFGRLERLRQRGLTQKVGRTCW